ncbi:SDR family NAD(P)-dependent oxidoreductase, partial [Desulfovibrio desulfuricans]|nr:SDR family NAD(P)-dependent oxidoreductase [Desulfovibrio desulfuricans]
MDKELEMINTNIRAVHILSKLFLRDFVKKDSGYILNVASSAAFLPGPLMATYYATKAYVQRLTLAMRKELQKHNSHVSVSVLCPGPV